MACLYFTIVVGGAFLFQDGHRIMMYLAGASNFSIAWPAMIVAYACMCDCDESDYLTLGFFCAFGYLHMVSAAAAALCLLDLVPALVPLGMSAIADVMCFTAMIAFATCLLERAKAADETHYSMGGFFVGLIPLFLSLGSHIDEDRSKDFPRGSIAMFVLGVCAIPAVVCLLYWLYRACRPWKCTLPCHCFRPEAPAQSSDKPSRRTMDAYSASCETEIGPLKAKVGHLFEHMRALHEEMSPLKANVDHLFEKMCVIEAVLHDLNQHHKSASIQEERIRLDTECV